MFDDLVRDYSNSAFSYSQTERCDTDIVVVIHTMNGKEQRLL